MHWDGGAKRQGRATPTTPAVVSFHLMTAANERFTMWIPFQVVIIIIMIMMPITPQTTVTTGPLAPRR